MGANIENEREKGKNGLLVPAYERRAA